MPKAKKPKSSFNNSSNKTNNNNNNNNNQKDKSLTIKNLIQSFKPLKSPAPKKKHEATYLLKEENKVIFSLSNIFTKKECMSLVNFAEEQTLERTTQRQSKYNAFRDNHRLQFYSQEFANVLFERIHLNVPNIYKNKSIVGLNSNIRFYRYGKLQRFGPHVDQSEVDRKSNCQSMFTVLFYLNDSFDSNLRGGETIFYTSDSKNSDILVYKPSTGSALIHGHGEHCLTHEGSEVTDGFKYILRTDVMYSI